MEFRNPQLYAAARAYVQTGLGALASRCGSQDRLVHEAMDWVPSGDKLFVLRARLELSWFLCVERHKDVLHALPEYGRLVGVLRADVVIAPQLDTLVGSPFGRLRLEADGIVDSLITRTADLMDGFEFREHVFAGIYREVEQALYDTEVEHITVAPVPHLTCETLPIRFDALAALDALTDEEIGMCARLGILRPHFGDIGMIHVDSKCGIRSLVRLAKVVGPKPAERPPDRPDPAESISRVILALRLLKGARVYSPGHATYSKNWLVRGHRSWRLTPVELRHAPKCALSTTEVEPLVRVWRALGSDGVKKREAVGGALRRFEYAGERYRPEDRLVDLMVAAESLFLEDAGDPQSRGELRYRLAVRSAFFIEIPGRTRRHVFDLMRRAYDTRSGVVHGNIPESVTLSGEVLSLEEFTNRVEDHIRAALMKAVEIAEREPEGRPLVAWDDLILSG